MNDAILQGMLVKLCDNGRVQRCKQEKGKGGWALTDEEYTIRRDDVDV